MESIDAYQDLRRWDIIKARDFSWYDPIPYIMAVEWALAVDDPSFI